MLNPLLFMGGSEGDVEEAALAEGIMRDDGAHGVEGLTVEGGRVNQIVVGRTVVGDDFQLFAWIVGLGKLDYNTVENGRRNVVVGVDAGGAGDAEKAIDIRALVAPICPGPRRGIRSHGRGCCSRRSAPARGAPISGSDRRGLCG